MIHRSLVSGLLLALTTFSCCQPAPKDLLYRIPGMDRFTVRPNILYKTADSQPLHADFYLPPADAPQATRPAVIFVLGDAPPETLRAAKDWRFFKSYGALAVASGYVGVTFNHRSSQDYQKFSDVRSDVVDLLRHVRDHASDFGIDRERLALWFFSGSGPHLPVVMGENARFVKCAVAYYTVLAPSPRAQLPDNVVREFNAVEQLKLRAPHVPPMLIARAGKDSPRLNGLLDEFRDAAAKVKAPLVFLDHPTGQHAFDILDDDDTTRDILRRTMEFLGKHLEPSRVGQ